MYEILCKYVNTNYCQLFSLKIRDLISNNFFRHNVFYYVLKILISHIDTLCTGQKRYDFARAEKLSDICQRKGVWGMKRCLPFSSLVSTGVTPVLFKQSPISTSSFPLFCLWLQTPPLLMFPFRPILTNLFSASLLRTYPCLIRKKYNDLMTIKIMIRLK